MPDEPQFNIITLIDPDISVASKFENGSPKGAAVGSYPPSTSMQ
jgi:hypothetical protein